MAKKSLFIIPCFWIFLCLCGLSFASPKISVSQTNIDLGGLAEGKIYEYSFFVSNDGDSELKVNFVRPNCGCITIIMPKGAFTLSARQKKEIRFTYNTTGYAGKVHRVIFLESNDPQNPVVKIEVLTEVMAEKEVILQRFKSFNLAVITVAGLIDGINPCAFTVLVFFVSFLVFVGYSRREMGIVGGAFILAVFLTYLAIGLGLFEFARRLVVFAFLVQWVYTFIAFLAVALGLVSIYDFWIYKKTKDPDRIKLKLPTLVKKQIQEVIREKTDIREETGGEKKGLLKFILASLSCGFIVSFLELICTGQLYLPIIIYILKSGTYKSKALGYLLFYNFMFIVPLVIILILGILGMTSQAFAKLAREKLGYIKLVTAMVFLALGIILLVMR